MERTLTIIPTYNEIENIDRIVRAVLSLDLGVDVLVVDDNSPDGTGDRVRALQVEYGSRLHLLSRSKKDGLGMAYLAGFGWGLARGYDYLCELDADFSHDPNDVPRLVGCCRGDGGTGADVAIGSRYVRGVNVVNWPLSRVLMSYCASVYVRLVSGMPVRDATAGFVCYRAGALRELVQYPVRMRGYGFQIEMKYLAYRLGYCLREVPIVFTDRTAGASKMSGGIFSEALWGVLRMRFLRLRKRGGTGVVNGA